MFGRGKKQPPVVPLPDVLAGFPRGLPDGDRAKPMATAAWAGGSEVLDSFGVWKPGQMLLGSIEGKPVGFLDDRHVLTVAGSRAGKGVSLIVPNLLQWPGSCIAIDPKGELATITARRRGELGTVHVLDPYNRVTGPGAAFRSSFNPLAGLDPESDAGLEMAGQIADCLVVQQEGAGSHWTQSARAFLRGLVLYVAAHEPEATRNLIRVRELVTDAGEPFLLHMAECGGVAGRAAKAMLLKPLNERGSILSTCDVQTDFLEGGPMRRVLGGHGFDLEDMKAGTVTVFLCLPASRLATHGRWLRLMIGLALEAMERTGPLRPGRPPVLFCLDEFAALGHMEAIEKAAGQVAGFGVKLWPVVQDLTQLRRDYREAWETFIGNAGLLSFFGNTDLTTLDHIARRLGECEVIRSISNVSEGWNRAASTSAPDLISILEDRATGSVQEGEHLTRTGTAQETIQKTQLMTPDEVGRHFARETGRILVLVPDRKPAVLRRLRYHDPADAGLFGGLYDPPPGLAQAT